MSLKVFAIHKRESISFQNTQDKYAYTKDLSTIALSDGATQAFESGIWAEILVNSYIVNPSNKSSIFLNLLLKAANRFKREVNKNSIKDETKAETKALEGLLNTLYKKGSYCTFVGVEIENDIAKIASYGDSVLFHFRNNILINSIPVNKSSDLDLHSNFLNTNILNDQKYFVEKYFKSENINLEKDDILILSTDAFSKYLLDNTSFLDELIDINSFKEFNKCIGNQWDKYTLEEDDITIMIYKHDGSDKIVKIEPDNNFKFKEEPKIKIPLKPTEPKLPKWNSLKYILIGLLLLLISFALSRYMFPKSEIIGCMDKTACDYDSTATTRGNCTYPFDKHGNDYLDCDGVCINDMDGDSICDEAEIPGCTDPTAFNYNPKATDNGECIPVIYGCTDTSAFNYNSKANTNDRSCIRKKKYRPRKNGVNNKINKLRNKTPVKIIKTSDDVPADESSQEVVEEKKNSADTSKADDY